MISVIVSLFFGILNCAAGRKFFGSTESTEVGRIIAVTLMGLIAGILAAIKGHDSDVIAFWVALSLLFWRTGGWDADWSAAIGNDLGHPGFIGRLWGLGRLTSRMCAGMPCIVVLASLIGHPELAIYSMGMLLLGVPYFISGYIIPRKYVIAFPEMVVGGVIGKLVCTVLGINF